MAHTHQLPERDHADPLLEVTAQALRDIERLFGGMTSARIHPNPIPRDVRIDCDECGKAMHETDVNWVDEDVALCDACYYREPEVPTAADRNGGAHGFNRRMGR